ncbi:MAG: protoporphyrinogen oxidase [Magnetococcus sp. YQC-5]
MFNSLVQKRVVVIGGGISGLACAFQLRRKGINVRVLESSNRAGGVIRSERVDGFLLEHAATCLFNYLPEVDFFCRNLGLESEQVYRQEAARRRYLLRDGQPMPVPMDVGGFIRTGLISWRGKLRLLLEPFIPRGAVRGEQESVAGFISRRFGSEIYARAIEPYISGTLAGDGDRACLRSTFSQFAALEDDYGSILKGAVARKMRGMRSASCNARVFSFREGMSALPDAIVAHLGADFLPGRRVNGIERCGPRWEVEAQADDGVVERYEADAVLVATPAYAAALLLRGLSRDLGELLAGITYAPMVVTHLGYERSAVGHAMDGIGCLVPKCETGFDLLGSLWPGTLFAGRAPAGRVMFMNYLGGARSPGMLERSDDELLERSQENLHRMFGVSGQPVLTRITRHQRALPQYNLGHQMFLRDVENHLALLPGIFLAGNYLRGVSVRVSITQGEQMAERIKKVLQASSVRVAPLESLLRARSV